MKPRKLALLFLILGFGALVETAYSLKTRMAIGPMGCRVLTGRFQGPSYSFEVEETRDNLPAGLSFLGRPYDDGKMIRLAYAYEQATHHRRPPASTTPL